MNFTTLIMLIFTAILAIGLVSKGWNWNIDVSDILVLLGRKNWLLSWETNPGLLD